MGTMTPVPRTRDESLVDDALSIVIATIADAGSLLEGTTFEPRFVSLALDGAVALYGLEISVDSTVLVKSLGEIGPEGRRALKACVKYHIDECLSLMLSLDTDRSRATYRPEIARGKRVLAALEALR